MNKELILPKKFPLKIGREGDVFANISSPVIFEIRRKNLFVRGEKVEVNGRETSQSILRRGDVVKVESLLIVVEKKWIAVLREGIPVVAAGFVVSFLLVFSVGKGIQKRGVKANTCSVQLRAVYKRAFEEKKFLSLAIKELKKCSRTIKGEEDKEKIMTMIGRLSLLFENEYRRLKFEAESAIREKRISDALRYLKSIRELSGDPESPAWKYATERMREAVK